MKWLKNILKRIRWRRIDKELRKALKSSKSNKDKG